MSEEPEERKSLAERMVAAGESVENAGKATTKAGNSMMVTGCLVFVVIILALAWWAVAC